MNNINNKEDLIREQLCQWFEANRQGKSADKPCFWRLYQVRGLSSVWTSKALRVSENTEIDDLNGSVNLLINQMEALNYVKVFCVRLMKNNTDSAPLTRNIENPYFSAVGLYGMPKDEGKSNNANFGLIMQLMEARISAIESAAEAKIQSTINELQTKQTIAELNAKIEAVKNEKKTALDSLIEGVKEPLFELIAQKMAGAPQITAESAADNEPNNETISPIWQELGGIVTETSNYYQDLHNLLGELCVLAKYSPEKARAIRLKINMDAVEVQKQILAQQKNKEGE